MRDNIPWSRVVIEGLVIVVSILLAFGIDAWWDGRQEEASRVHLLSILQSDFTATRQLLESSIRRAEETVNRSRGFAEWTANDLDLSRDSVQSLAAGIFRGIPFQPAIPHYEAAIASGEIARIDSDTLLVALNRFERGLASYEQHNVLSGEIFYWGPIHDLRMAFGSQRAFLEAGELRTAATNPAVSAAAESMYVVQNNMLGALRAMSQATDLILVELNGLLDDS